MPGPRIIFTVKDKSSLKFIWKDKGTRVAKNNPDRKNKMGGIIQLRLFYIYSNQDCVVLVDGMAFRFMK